MEPATGSLIVVHFVHKQAVGVRFRRHRNHWPLHVTIVPWFASADIMQVQQSLGGVAAHTRPFALTVGERRMFGRHEDVPVNIIADQTEIKRLHEHLAVALSAVNAAFYQPHWMGERFDAHITRHDVDACVEGERLQVEDFHLVRLDADGICEVVARFELAGTANRVKMRLDQALVARQMVSTRSQAESYIKLGKVVVDDRVITKPGYAVAEAASIRLMTNEQYVSRAALKLASVANTLGIDFRDKVVLDVGSSTGGFTDYALQHGARKVIDVEVGTNQLHPRLHGDPRIELHEQTDIRDMRQLSEAPDVVVIDVSFISLRDIIPRVTTLCTAKTDIIAMVKPQFEAQKSAFKHKGVIKNDRIRREILKDFEIWVHDYCVIIDKADSSVSGAKGNQERFYKLRKVVNE